MTISSLFISCGKALTTADTTTPPAGTEKSSKDNPMDKYMELKDKNSPPSEILKFAKENTGKLKREDADIVIKALIKMQKQKFKNYEDKLLSQDFNARINRYSMEDLKNLDKIKDADLKSFLQDAYNDGFKLFEAEGMKDLEIDYGVLNDDFSVYLTEEPAAYIGIMAETSRQHPFEDGALVITWDELAGRIIKIEDFLKKYTVSEYKEELGDLHLQYLNIYLLGLNNTPAFDMDTNVIKPDVQKSFKTTKDKYPDSELASVLTGYLQLLELNNNKKTKEVLQYVGKITGNPEFGTTEN